MENLIRQLLKEKVIDKEKAAELEKELKDSGKTEEELLIEKEIVSEKFLFGLKSALLKIPLGTLPEEAIPLTTLELVPEEAAKNYKMVPLIFKDNQLEVGMVYPENLSNQEALKFLSRQGKWSYQISLIDFSTLNNILRQYKTVKEEVKTALEELEAELKGEKVRFKTKLPREEEEEMEALVEEAPISKMVAVIVRHGVEGNASDIHIESMRKEVRVRYRVDGVLYSSLLLPKKIAPAIISRVKILSNLKIDETRIPQDGRFTANFDGKEIDFRVSTFPTPFGEKVAIRILDPSKGLLECEQLGLVGRNLELVKKATKRPFGLIFATGPTGSGKTTTLYSILQILNKEGVNIVTLEDPIEYFIEGINQSQVKPEIGYTFASGLRQIVRQDPDIIMVGEVRDEETASLAIHAALTGHIVLSTLHTNNALGVIPRLVDMAVQPFLIPASLALTIAQRLVRVLCPSCKKKVKPAKQVRDLILKEMEALPAEYKKDLEISPNSKDFYLYQAVGCKKCQQKGFKGRIGIFEVLEMTKFLEEIILTQPSEAKLAEEAKRQGMLTMRQDGILKVLKGITTIEEVVATTG